MELKLSSFLGFLFLSVVFDLSEGHRHGGRPGGGRPGGGRPGGKGGKGGPGGPGPIADGRITRRTLGYIKDDLSDLVQGAAIGHVVRLAFHDCVGGCDGCLNHNDPDNQGLMLTTVDKLNQRYDERNYKERFGLSRADFWQLAAIRGIEIGIDNANAGEDCGRGQEECQSIKLDVNFKIGRQDCPTSPTTDALDNLPGAMMGHDETMAFFADEFGLDADQSSALLGAHTVGRASGALGFDGFWKEDAEEATKFDNRYYRMLLDRTVKYKQVSREFEGKQVWQWEGHFNGSSTPASFMLHVDAALLMKPDIATSGEDEGKSSCDFETCPLAETAPEVQEYAENDGLWIAEFAAAYEIMIHKGCDNCREVPDF